MAKMKKKYFWKICNSEQSVSEAVAQKIDNEIRKLVDEGYNKAEKF